jgi:nucleosome assembly protein 1-like 1
MIQIIPRAIDYFTGKALEYDVMEEDDDDFDELDDDDEDGQFDDEV